jgi:uncharacterized protein (DUF433 family)
MADQPVVALDLSRFIETRIFGERPHIRGRRVPVAFIAYSKQNEQWDVDELAYQYTPTRAEVLAALLYYEEHKVEIDAQEETERTSYEEMKRLYAPK